MWRDHDPAHIVGRRKSVEPAHPSMWSGSWAVLCPLIFLCLSERDRWPTTSVFGVLRKINTCVFRRPLCQSRGVGGFSWRYSLRLPHFLLEASFRTRGSDL